VVSSIARSTASGSTAVLGVPFPYLDKTHVQVRLNGVLKTLGVDYSFTTDSTHPDTAGNPAAGVMVERKRVTPTDPLTNFTPGQSGHRGPQRWHPPAALRGTGGQ
jgi:hypothetical protein